MHDERMKELIPSIMDSISAFFAPILNTLYSAQIDLYQNLYVSVHEYATAQGLTNTATVVEDCQELFEPMRQRAESEVKSLREGKVAKTPMGDHSKPGLFGRKSSTSVIPAASPPAYSSTETRKPSSLKAPPPPPSGPSPISSPNLGARKNSYGNGRTPSSSSLASQKKKPPPPPPPKPSLTPKPEFVVAKYDFAGQSEGDLPFRAGDRIKIVKKTDSLEDWWEGECNGAKGSFPRNYCD
jgi:amphiphysin